jgi:hypothetical protein
MTCVASSALSAPLPGQVDCKRPAARQFAQGETVVLTETTGFPCRILFVNGQVALRADSHPDITDIGQYVARSPDGRFFTAASRGAEVHVWDAEGKFVRILGREGKGPGEFARSGKFIGFSRSGDVFIADNQRRWSVFSSGLEFLRTLPATATGTAMSNT